MIYLVLLAQPIVSLPDESWVGFEALVRWQDGARQRQPAEFLPPAEETGQIVAVGAWVPVSYTHLRAHETVLELVCRLLLEKKK